MRREKLSSGSSGFYWSSLRCFYNLIGKHLWWIQLIGHALERHTPVYLSSHSWQCMSDQKPTHEVETGLCRGTDLAKGNTIFLQHWRSPRTQWPPSFLNRRSLEPPRLTNHKDNLTQLERICRGEWEKLPKYLCKCDISGFFNLFFLCY